MKRKHDSILSKNERLQSENQTLETKKEAMNVQLVIMKKERSDFEARISQLESRESAASQQIEELKNRVEELVEQKGSLKNQLKIANEKKKGITPFCDQAYKIQRNIHQSQVNLTGDIYKVRLIMTILEYIAVESMNLRIGLMEVGGKVKIQLTWIEANSKFSYHLPQK